MSPRPRKIVPPVNEVEPLVKVDVPVEETEATPPQQENPISKPFLEIEEYRGETQKLEIFNANPAYDYRWCNKDLMGNGRKGIWHTVLRNHPDFAGLRVAVDHSPTENFFRLNDLILCCCRKETAAQKRKANLDKIKRRDDEYKAEEETLIKVNKDTVKQNINTLEREIEKQDSVIAN
jgi:hypothetical protein